MVTGSPERGSGALSSVFGVMVFLTLLMFTSHLLLNLWLMSAVDGVAHDAATDVATSGAGDQALRSVERSSIERARSALGDYADQVHLEFEADPSGTTVVLHVVAPELTLLPPMAARLAGASGLDRRIVVARELPGPEFPTPSERP